MAAVTKNWRRAAAARLKARRLAIWRAHCKDLSADMIDRLSGELERYMDLLSARQKLVAANIANADTPGYRTKDLDFQSEFRNAFGGEPRAMDAPGLAARNDGNNVSLDRESRLLAENALRFQLASNLMRSRLRAMKSAIDEGKS